MSTQPWALTPLTSFISGALALMTELFDSTLIQHHLVWFPFDFKMHRREHGVDIYGNASIVSKNLFVKDVGRSMRKSAAVRLSRCFGCPSQVFRPVPQRLCVYWVEIGFLSPPPAMALARQNTYSSDHILVHRDLVVESAVYCLLFTVYASIRNFILFESVAIIPTESICLSSHRSPTRVFKRGHRLEADYIRTTNTTKAKQNRLTGNKTSRLTYLLVL